MINFSKSPENIINLFDLISKNYDKLNNIMSLGQHLRIKKEVIKNIKKNSCAKILDLCTGTGDMAELLKKEYPDAEVLGVDFSAKMLEIASKKHSDIEFLEADCSNLPFEDELFDICLVSFGLRNVENIESVLREIYRVLKKDGIFVNIDLGKPNKFVNIFAKPYMYLWVPFVGSLFHRDKTPYKYLAVSNEDFPSPNSLIELYEGIGFKNSKNKNYFLGQIATQSAWK